MAMRKKDKRAVVETGGTAELTHNPFGALAGPTAAAGLPAGPAAGPDGVAAVVQTRADKRAQSRGRLVLRREKKGRRGKAAVIIAGLRAQAQLAEPEIATLAKQLKQELGCGGSVEAAGADTEIVVQGDQPARVAEWLRAAGFRVDGVTR